MKVTISQVHLLNVARDEAEAAELWHAITEKNLGDWEAEWMPEQIEAIRRPQSGGSRAPALAARPTLELAREDGDHRGNVGQSGFQHCLRWCDTGDDDR